MSEDLIERLRGAAPLLALNPGGFAPFVADALGKRDDAALFIDCERTALGPTEAALMAQSARANGIPALMRALSSDPAMITRCLDCRIHGLVVPQVETAAQCQGLARILADHGATAPRTALIVQIESVAGHAALDAIVGTPGVDAVLIGPNDLAASMGRAGQPGDAAVRAAVDDIAARVRARGLPFGLPVTEATAGHWRAQGAGLFYVSLAQSLAAGLTGLVKSGQRAPDPDR